MDLVLKAIQELDKKISQGVKVPEKAVAVRSTDNLGRVTIPMSIRKQLGITDKNELEIFVSDDTILIKKKS